CKTSLRARIMGSKRIELFGTREDYDPTIRKLEEAIAVKFVRTGLQDNPEFTIYHKGEDIPDLGVSMTGDINLDPTYLIMPSVGEPLVRAVAQVRGGTK